MRRVLLAHFFLLVPPLPPSTLPSAASMHSSHIIMRMAIIDFELIGQQSLLFQARFPFLYHRLITTSISMSQHHLLHHMGVHIGHREFGIDPPLLLYNNNNSSSSSCR